MKNFAHTFDSFINEMAIKSREEMYRPEKIEIDLNGPEGNAFYLMGLARRLYRRKYPKQREGFNLSQKLARNLDPELEMKSAEDLFIEEMMSEDYEHLLKVFDEEFGDMVTLYR